jgi:predicted nucleotide-binding protein (sugar kinase/HSP70/actin superfamily)
MLLQAMADQFGVPITEYADNAFEASLAPKFSYGCAVFLDTDRVNFQKEGFQKQELLAGLAQVLPKNVWQYVVQIPRLASLGRKFVLQGGTQYNLAAVKAQVDYIKERVPDAEVYVHPHTGEAGAIGAAMETLRRYERSGTTRFIGIDATLQLEFTTKNDESTTCHFCPNECSRTFIDTQRPDGSLSRYISGFSCEKGTVESKEAMLEVVAAKKKIASQYPNMLTYEGKKIFTHFFEPAPMPKEGTPVRDFEVIRGVLKVERRPIVRPFQRSDAHERLRRVRVGMPRVLNFYSTAPFFRTYFETLGIPKQNVIFSDVTDETMWTEGGRYGSVDPCFPSKVCQAHIHNLLFHKHDPDKGRGLNYIYFPVKTFIPNFIVDTHNNGVCPVVAGTPNVMKAAFTKEVDFFATRGIEYIDEPLNMDEINFLKKNLFDTWGKRLGITQDENDFAVDQGHLALETYNLDVQEKGQAILDTVEAENDIAILVLARPYHADPGIGHSIPEEFQALGYPILSIRSIPKQREYLDRYYKKELDSGLIKTPLQISHVWPENYLANSAQRVWAANFAAHHPNVAILDLSSFKCGSDAPTYGLTDSVIQAAKVPAAALHDLDANKPGGSIKIRVKTYAHSLQLHKERLEDAGKRKRELELSIERKRLELLELKTEQLRKMQRRDPALESALEAVRQRVRDYVPAPAVETGRQLLRSAKNLVQIRRKPKGEEAVSQ